jgi:hypothetical protein
MGLTNNWKMALRSGNCDENDQYQAARPALIRIRLASRFVTDYESNDHTGEDKPQSDCSRGTRVLIDNSRHLNGTTPIQWHSSKKNHAYLIDFGAPGGTRTPGPLVRSTVLRSPDYLLKSDSYALRVVPRFPQIPPLKPLNGQIRRV